MKLNEIVEVIKAENPNGLIVGNEQDGYIALSEKECEIIYEEWAKGRIAKSEREVNAQTKKQATIEKLTHLGLDKDDLKALGLG